jgi:malate dehydrogenase (oxaloacetate-decarboxylating)
MPTREELEAKAKKPGEEALRLHAFYKGKVQVVPKCAIRGPGDFAIWYTPGVAAPCKAIQANPELVYEYTNKGNCIAIVSDGTRVLGLGAIGPTAGLPVMEGKALLFKYLGGVDAVPLCLAAQQPAEIVRLVKAIEPSFGGINLEDIAQPKCFRILDDLRKELRIPVWHDDQQGSGTVLLAGLINAVNVVGKDLRTIRIAMIGMGAANVATYRLMKAAGVDPAAIVACDSKGILHRRREDIERQQEAFTDKWRVCQESNVDVVTGGIAEAMRGADVCIAFSTPGPGIIKPEWVRAMAKDAIVFSCANPVPEIWPWDATEAGARIVATGRSDFPNQVNNSLVFPAVFRGTLDARARTISDEMAIAAAHEIARQGEKGGLSEERIVPRMEDWEVVPQVAAAVAVMAQEQGLSSARRSREHYVEAAKKTIRDARDTLRVLMAEGLLPSPPVSAKK